MKDNRPTWHLTFQLVLRIAFGAGLLTVLLLFVDAKTVWDQISKLNVSWMAVSAFSLIIVGLIGATNLYLFINREGKIKFSEFLPIYWVSWAFSLVVPGQLGDLFSLSALMRRYGLCWKITLGRVLVDKLISLTVLAVLGVTALVQLLDSWFLSPWMLPLLIGVVFGIFAIRRLADYGAGRLGRIAKMIEEVICELLTTLRHAPSQVAFNIVLTWMKIGLTGFAYLAMFNAVGENSVTLLQVLPLMAASALVAYIPISFNGLGTVELTGIILFSLIGVTEAVVLATYLSLRLLLLALAWLPSSLWIVSRRF